VFESVTG
jgi:hypothetical protein